MFNLVTGLFTRVLRRFSICLGVGFEESTFPLQYSFTKQRAFQISELFISR